MRKIAILGGGPSLESAPVSDPTWALWGMPWMDIPELDLYFEIHAGWRNGGYYPCGEQPGTVVEYLNDITSEQCPIIMAKKEPDVIHSIGVLFEPLDLMAGRRYLESSVGYMLAMAALVCEEGDTVGLWGVDLNTDEEYGYQRPNAEFWVGYLRGQGVDVFVPRSSALLKSAWAIGHYGAAKPVFVGDGMAFEARETVKKIMDERTKN
jgi:hypothetical protein